MVGDAPEQGAARARRAPRRSSHGRGSPGDKPAFCPEPSFPVEQERHRPDAGARGMPGSG